MTKAKNKTSQNNGLKDYVDSQLQKRMLVTGKYNSSSLKRANRDVIASIMEARKKDFWETRDVEKSYEGLLRELETIQIGNSQIEQRVKLELLGIDNNPFKRVLYYIIGAFYKLIGNNDESAQDIMKKQLKRVDSVSQGLNQASRVIDERAGKLDGYYDQLVQKIRSNAEYRVVLSREINSATKLMKKTEQVFDLADDPLDRMEYNSAMRKLRKQLQTKMWELKLTDKELLDLKSELPFIDTFGDFCQTYSFALKESFQNVQAVKSHLSNVMGLYFEMMRSNHIYYALKESVQTLIDYTDNMTKSLLRAKGLILEVNKNELFNNGYEQRKQDLEKMVDEVFDSNADAFNRLEDKVGRFLATKN
jgi:hypothetical protein